MRYKSMNYLSEGYISILPMSNTKIPNIQSFMLCYQNMYVLDTK